MKNAKELDPDGDHFTNLEEFLAGTDPTDPKSIPAYFTKLRLVKFDPVPFCLPSRPFPIRASFR